MPIPGSSSLDTSKSATIASGQSVSGEVFLGPDSLLAIRLPASFEGDRIGFKSATAAGGTFLDQYQHDVADTLYTVEVGASRQVAIPSHVGIGLGPWLQLVSLNTSNAAAAVAADREITLITRRLQ